MLTFSTRFHRFGPSPFDALIVRRASSRPTLFPLLGGCNSNLSAPDAARFAVNRVGGQSLVRRPLIPSCRRRARDCPPYRRRPHTRRRTVPVAVVQRRRFVYNVASTHEPQPFVSPDGIGASRLVAAGHHLPVGPNRQRCFALFMARTASQGVTHRRSRMGPEAFRVQT